MRKQTLCNRHLTKLRSAASIPLLILTISLISLFSITAITASPALAITGSEVITTDQLEYMIGDTAVISGSNFDPNAVITIDVVRVDGVIDSGVITSDGTGSFAYSYYLNPNAIPDPELAYFGTLTVNARDVDTTILATTTFLDNPNYLLQGCSRFKGDCDDYLSGTGWANGPDPMDGWTTGNVKGWYEQEFVPYRLRINLRKSSDAKTYYIMNQHDHLRNGVYGVDALGDYYIGAGHDSVYPEGTLTKSCTYRTAGTGILTPTTGTPCYVSGPIYSDADDDGDSLIDEEIVDGIDNDGDGLIDEDVQNGSNPAQQIQFVTAVKFEPSEAGGSNKRWALYWKARLATGSSGFPGSSLHAKTTATGSQDVPIADILAPASADLAITKSDSPDPVSAGGTITYTINVTNNGPHSATNIQVVDTLPVEATFVSAIGTNWTCSHSAGVVTCNLDTNYCSGTIPSIYITVTAPSPPSQITITNSATVSGSPSDPNTGNNTATETTTVNAVPIPVSDLSISKSDAPDPVNASGVLVYTLTVTNSGPDNATNVIVTDTLPVGVTYGSASGSGWSCGHAAGTVTCSRSNLSVTTSPAITITVTAPAAGGVINNTAEVSADQDDPDNANNSITIPTTVSSIADLSITKTDSPDPVNQGAQITYTITVSNAGPSTAPGVTVTDTLPLGSTYVSAIGGTGWTCNHVSGIVTCTKPSMNSGTTAPVITLKVTAPPQSGSISNSVTVSSSVLDPNDVNNTASALTTVNTAANLSLTKTDSPDPATAGQNITYTIVATNNGPDTANNVIIYDYLPPGAIFVSATVSPAGTCTLAGSIVTCSGIGNLANGATATATVVIKSNESGTLGNGAEVTSTTYDTNTNNNDASAITGVIASSDLSITKTDSADPVTAGANFTYTLTVTNNGPSTASTLTVSDPLPAGVSFVSASGTGWTCNESLGTVNCTRTSLAPGPAPAINITVTAPSDGGSINNTAIVSASTSDPIPGNNSATQGTTVTASSDLAISKADSPDPVITDDTLTYTLSVNNNGPSTAAGVTVTDVLPSTVTFVSAGGTGWLCGESAGVVTCTVASLGTGPAPNIVITVTAPPTSGTVTNTANITSGVNDPNLSNNNSSQVTTVNPSGMTGAELSIIKTDSADPVYAGSSLSYTVTVTNNGPDPATGITVTDTLPAGSAFVSAGGSGWTCNNGSGTVTCTLPTLAVGPAPDITITVNAPVTSGLITNTAEVSANETDPNSSNNTVAENTVVDPLADLSVMKTDSPDPVPQVGDNITYTITVTNNGPGTATGVEVTDTLNALTYESVTTTQGACSGTTTVTCTIGTLANGDSATITIIAGTNPPKGMISNTANVTANEPDPNTGNNSATATTNVGDVSRIIYLSTRSKVETGDNRMIAGFIVEGSLPKTLLLRARGPSMTGVSGVLANPYLRLFSHDPLVNDYIAQNDNWGDQSDPLCAQKGYVCGSAADIINGGWSLCPVGDSTCDTESAILVTLPPGTYSTVMSGVGGTTGVGLVQLFDVDTSTEPKLSYISTRARVLTGFDRMIGGFIIGAGGGDKQVFIRARGPSMTGVSGVLANPYIRLFSHDPLVNDYIAQNDNWGDQSDPLCAQKGYVCGSAADITNGGLALCPVGDPTCDTESAILITLPPGTYSAVMSGVGGTTGVGLVQISDIVQ